MSDIVKDMESMAVGVYFRTLREGRKTPRGKPTPLNSVARKVGEIVRRDVYASTIKRMEEGSDLGGDLLAALVEVLGGRAADITWLLRKGSEATEEDARRCALNRLAADIPTEEEMEGLIENWRREKRAAGATNGANRPPPRQRRSRARD